MKVQNNKKNKLTATPMPPMASVLFSGMCPMIEVSAKLINGSAKLDTMAGRARALMVFWVRRWGMGEICYEKRPGQYRALGNLLGENISRSYN